MCGAGEPSPFWRSIICVVLHGASCGNAHSAPRTFFPLDPWTLARALMRRAARAVMLTRRMHSHVYCRTLKHMLFDQLVP